MKLLELTLDSPAENLALDEALLDAAELTATKSFAMSAHPEFSGAETDASEEVLRLWEPAQTMVVIGSSSHLADEVNLDACGEHGIPVLRRASGGAAIVTGPGCLMYAVLLSYQHRPQLRSIDRAHEFVLGKMATAINQKLESRVPGVTAGLSSSGSTTDSSQPEAPIAQQSASGLVPHTAYRLLPTSSRAGISDLALGDKKFSGNALRCKRHYLLYHGTLMYRFPLDEISALLKVPTRQPAYRQHRSHADFLTNLPLDAAPLRQALSAAFTATESCQDWPHSLTATLAAEKYSSADWTARL